MAAGTKNKRRIETHLLIAVDAAALMVGAATAGGLVGGASGQLVQQRHGDTGAGGAGGMAQRNGAAVDVHLQTRRDGELTWVGVRAVGLGRQRRAEQCSAARRRGKHQPEMRRRVRLG